MLHIVFNREAVDVTSIYVTCVCNVTYIEMSVARSTEFLENGEERFVDDILLCVNSSTTILVSMAK